MERLTSTAAHRSQWSFVVTNGVDSFLWDCPAVALMCATRAEQKGAGIIPRALGVRKPGHRGHLRFAWATYLRYIRLVHRSIDRANVQLLLKS